MITIDNIKKLLLKGERVTFEAKRAETDVPKSVWETYSAFANTEGGTIVLGVEEHWKEKDPTKRFEIIGVKNADKIVKDFWNTINSNKVSHNILCSEDVSVVEIDGKQIVCIQVPQTTWRTRPVYLNDNVFRGSFRRNHEGDYHCTEEQVRAYIRDANDDGNDGLLMEHYGMDDVDPNTLRQYRSEFRDVNKDHIWNGYDDKTFLRSFGAYIIDRETGKEGLSLGGLLMFGTGLAIRERLSNFRMDYVDMSHLVGDERYHDRLTYDGRWENNLYQFFHLVIPKLTLDLPRPFRMPGIRREDDTLQQKAVREAFANAIIHSDVLLSGGVLRIDKYDDRLCLRNPGTLKLPVYQIYEGGTSRARNPRIQNMLRMIGYGENLGSGFPMILDAWKKSGWIEPELNNKIDIDEVELVLHFKVDENFFANNRDETDVTQNVTSNEPSDVTKNEPSCDPSNVQKNNNLNTDLKVVKNNGQNNILKDVSKDEPSCDPSDEPSNEPSNEPSRDPSDVTQNVTSLSPVCHQSDSQNVPENVPDNVPENVPDVGSSVGSVSVVQLTERQKEIYELIVQNPTISRQQMSAVLSVAIITIKRDIAALQKMGVLAREGKTSAGHWVLLKNIK